MKNNKIHILDIGCSNTNSVSNMILKLNGFPQIVQNSNQLVDAKKIILPGVGSFDSAISKLQAMNIIDTLYELVVVQKIPILGICLGMQLFGEGSEEGNLEGLGYIKGYNKKFNFSDSNKNLKIPHMGWNSIVLKKQNRLFEKPNSDTRYYFVHSYHFVADNIDDIAAETNYGYSFPSIIIKDNIFGTQFHPEKSHRYGKMILSNFLNIL